jgi:hypothetical protein
MKLRMKFNQNSCIIRSTILLKEMLRGNFFTNQTSARENMVFEIGWCGMGW